MIPAGVVGSNGHVGHRRGSARTWAAFTLRTLARSYLTILATFGLLGLAVLAGHWHGYVVETGSMQPGIRPGDLVITSPFRAADGRVPLGKVMVLHNPARPDRSDQYLVHRVVGRAPDGRYRTRGDANRGSDSTPAAPGAFVGRARLLVPGVGLPVFWLQHGAWAVLAVWGVGTGTAVLLALDRPTREVRDLRRGHQRRRPPRLGGVTAVLVLTLTLGSAGVGLAAFAGTTRAAASSWTAFGTPLRAYDQAVLADAPAVYLRLDDVPGDDAWDSSGHGTRGTYGGTVTLDQPGAATAGGGRGACLGTGGRVVTGGSAVADPTTFTLEAWFRTTSTVGGELVGFTDGQGQPSATGDRYVTMDAAGHLTYGAWGVGGSRRTVVSPLAYNDGGWHLLTLSATPAGAQQTSVLSVDGAVVASGRTTRPLNYSGWWRFGAGTLDPGAGVPAAPDFAGCLDDVAVYPVVLSAARTAAHFAAR